MHIAQVEAACFCCLSPEQAGWSWEFILARVWASADDDSMCAPAKGKRLDDAKRCVRVRAGFLGVGEGSERGVAGSEDARSICMFHDGGVYLVGGERQIISWGGGSIGGFDPEGWSRMFGWIFQLFGVV
jgi:hypothetical protein